MREKNTRVLSTSTLNKNRGKEYFSFFPSHLNRTKGIKHKDTLLYLKYLIFMGFKGVQLQF